jgi:hypothetical protein
VTHPRQAFDAIATAIAADPAKQIVQSRFWEEAFGNFHIAFTDAGNPRSVINDRFELVLSENLEGTDCHTILRSIRDADEGTILRSIGL